MMCDALFFWNSLAFSMIQHMLAIWSLVPLPSLKPALTSGSSWFTYRRLMACIHLIISAYIYMGFPCGSAGKESTCSVGDLGLIPGLGRSPGEGKGYLLQYSGLENSMDCIVHGVSKSLTQLSDFHFTIGIIHSPLCKPWLLTRSS